MKNNRDGLDNNHFIEEFRKKDWYLSKELDDDYTISDTDKYKTFYVTTSTNVITIDLPTAADNKDRILEFMKVDSAFDKTGATSVVVIDGEGAETIQGETTMEIALQYCGFRIKCTGTEWLIVGTFGACEVSEHDSAQVLCYYKYFSGTLDADASTSIAHGVSAGNIKHVSCNCLDATSALYRAYDNLSANDANKSFNLTFGVTNIVISNVGADIQGHVYEVFIKYIV